MFWFAFAAERNRRWMLKQEELVGEFACTDLLDEPFLLFPCGQVLCAAEPLNLNCVDWLCHTVSLNENRLDDHCAFGGVG